MAHARVASVATVFIGRDRSPIESTMSPEHNMAAAACATIAASTTGHIKRLRSAIMLLLLLLFMHSPTAVVNAKADQGGSRGRTIDANTGAGGVIYAINAGGDAHTDVNGIRFERDPLSSTKTDTTASDFGKQLLIGRVHPADMILYQTERYHHVSFGYDIPIRDDGDYVLVLKFCEVYFTASNMKVFDVILNDVITVVAGLDIYDRVGRGVAHDEYVPFSVVSDDRSRSTARLRVGNDESQLVDRIMRVDFIKSSHDNPKVNAIYVMKGNLEDVPKLVPLDVEDEIFSSTSESTLEPDYQPPNHQQRQEQQEKQQQQQHRRPRSRPSGPRNPDPYGLDESSTMLPIFIAIVAFIPILFCLCKL